MPDSVEQLVCRAKLGDAQAFQLLHNMFEESVLNQCKTYLWRHPAEVEDAAQDTFVRAWERLRGLRSDHAFGGWLVTIATTTCLNRLETIVRRRARETSLDVLAGQNAVKGLSNVSSASDKMEAHLVAEQLMAQVRQAAFQGTPPWDNRDLHIFYLRFVHEEIIDDVAELLGMPVSTVRFRIKTRIKPILKIVGENWKREEGNF